MSKIALCLTHKTLKEDRDELIKYGQSIDLAELRLDCINFDQYPKGIKDPISEFIHETAVPLILTIRRTDDGGYWGHSEKERLVLMDELLTLGFNFVDLEDDLIYGTEKERADKIAEKARFNNVKIIRSLHDFEGIPQDLAERIRENSLSGDLPKAAVTLNHSKDIITFMKAVQALEGQDKILLAMGERGLFSRILTEKIGSYLTFTSPVGGLQAASGQIDPETLKDQYRYYEHKKEDPLYGIIGNPVIQSRSPELHNSWLERKGLPGVYVPFLLDDLNNFASLDQYFNFAGLSVTIPFKEKILSFLDKRSDAVKAIGACNTYYKRNGQIQGENSDALGFLYPLLDSLKLKRFSEKPLKGYKCTLVGAGGASRAVIYSLVNSGADVLVLNRTLSSAEKLAHEFGARAALLSPDSLSLIKEYNRIIVQTTSLGMAPQEEKDPLSFYEFSGHEFVYDIIYKPSETVMMKRAKNAGCSILGGWEMLKEQGRVQFELFTGTSVPFD